MIASHPPVLKPTLEEVADLFESWRKGKPKRRSIPEKLWQAAVKLSGDYSVSQISRRLGLSYPELKRRVSSLPSAKQLNNDCHPGFVEFDLCRSIPVNECVMEKEDEHGTKIKISVKDTAGSQLLEVVKVFLG